MTLKVVGKIEPAPYKDPVKMLRNIADDIEAGEHGKVRCVALVTFGDAGLEVFGGGIDSIDPMLVTMFQAASMQLSQPLLDFEG